MTNPPTPITHSILLSTKYLPPTPIPGATFPNYTLYSHTGARTHTLTHVHTHTHTRTHTHTS